MHSGRGPSPPAPSAPRPPAAAAGDAADEPGRRRFHHTLEEKVALVAGTTRGAGRGIAIELGTAGAHIYATGRTTRDRRSEYGGAETIEETAELVEEAGGRATAVAVDHLEDQVRELVARVERDSGRLDILVDDMWGGEHHSGGGVRSTE